MIMTASVQVIMLMPASAQVMIIIMSPEVMMANVPAMISVQIEIAQAMKSAQVIQILIVQAVWLGAYTLANSQAMMANMQVKEVEKWRLKTQVTEKKMMVNVQTTSS